jgi:HD superfamily phosphohydrolase
MGKKKIINDPVYGFISFPYEILYDIIDHPYFQRLRRISQMGLSHYVYPGAIHTRFHHAMGALHLMTRAIYTLKDKGIEISDEEAQAACIAILMHDIGHGPFSHALEGLILPYDHESISLAYMELFNREMDGNLDLAISIFKNNYHKKFLNQLISGQLDVDRLDYLNRDSFFTGVAEGVIGYDRIIKMLNVVDDQLVVEEKGIYSIEKFLMSRRLMYLQVYLHKTSLVAEQMLILFIKVLKHEAHRLDLKDNILKNLLVSPGDSLTDEICDRYALLDDIDVMMALKEAQWSDNFILNYISSSILKRQLFNISLRDRKAPPKEVAESIAKVMKYFNVGIKDAESLVIMGREHNKEYDLNNNEIKILLKNGDVKPFSIVSTYMVSEKNTEMHYICSPRMPL